MLYEIKLLRSFQAPLTAVSRINILHQTRYTDRLGGVTRYERDRLGRLSKLVDAQNHSTTYQYCGCGGPESITDARNQATSFTYNNAGWKTDVVYPGNAWESYGYDFLGRMTSRTDSLGGRSYSYNNQGLLTVVSNAYGLESATGFDVVDNPVAVTDAAGVAISQTFDRLGRLLTRSVPGQGTETNVYTARGLTNYFGPDGKLTRYFFDAAGRKASEITPKNEVVPRHFQWMREVDGLDWWLETGRDI